MKFARTMSVHIVFFAAALAACGGASKDNAADTTLAASTAPTSTTSPPTTTEPATAAPTTPLPTVPPSTTAPPPTFTLYEQVAPPHLENNGQTVSLDPDAAVTDGLYLAIYRGGATTMPDIKVAAYAFWVDLVTCVDDVDTLVDECLVVNSLNNVQDPTGPEHVVSDVPFADDVYITVADATTHLSYWITPDELATIFASSPSTGAPAGYAFAKNLYFVMTVEGGQIVKFEQLWTAF